MTNSKQATPQLEINRLCARCSKDCKQSVVVTVVQCSLYERSDDQSDKASKAATAVGRS